MFKKISTFLLACLVLGLGLVVPSQAVTAEDLPTLHLSGGDYGLSQPYTCYNRGPGLYKVSLVFDALVEKDDQGPIPWLAEQWEVKDDGLTYIFKLREDVTWADGEAFDAEDVVFTYNYIQEFPQVPGNGQIQKPGFFESIEALNDYEVEFKLQDPMPGFIEAVISISILPQHIWQEIERPDEFTEEEALVGTGPFKLTDYSKKDGVYRFEAREDFWGPQPAVAAIEFVPVSDSVLALASGDIDISGIPADALASFEKQDKYTILEKPAVWGYRLRFNFEKVADFQNHNLRKAFAYAIDRGELVDKIARGAGVPASMGVLPPSHRDFNPDLPQYEQDIDKAREYLTEADVEERTYELLVGGDKEVRLAELLASQLQEAGIQIQVVSVDGKSRDARVAEGNYELAITGHGGWARDADYLRTRFSSEVETWSVGTPGYENPELNQLAAEQMVELDPVKRQEILFRMQELIAEDLPEIPLYMTTGYLVYNNEVYDRWMFAYDHHEPTHNKLSFLVYASEAETENKEK